MYKYDSCLVCGQTQFSTKFIAKDYTVSGEEFQIQSCDSCKFLFTNPRPDTERLGNYYKSEDYISHSDTSRGLINKLYKFVRIFTLRSKFKLIQQYANKGEVLDIGAGTGAFVNYLKEKGFTAVGIEPEEDARAQAKRLYNLDFKTEASLNHVADYSYSAITMWHVLEHVPALKERIAELCRLVTKDGVVVIAVPNHESLDALHYKEKWAAYDVPRHLYHFDKQSIKSLFEASGFDLVDICPMHFDSFYVSMLSEKYKGNNALGLLNAFFVGLKTFFIGGRKNSSSLIYIFKPKTH
ncbi:MAG: class I SAM-dependent methyltransferase [Bacteroidia bacterium]